MQCVFIYGPAASGKLTIATALQSRTGLRLFHNHLAVDAALSLFEFGTPGFVRLRDAIWLAAFAEAASTDQSFIFTFHPEASVPATFIDAATNIITRSGGRTLFVELTCSNAVVESRIVNADRAKYRKLTSLNQYRDLLGAGAFEFPGLLRPDLTIATDALGPDDAVSEICRLITQSGG